MEIQKTTGIVLSSSNWGEADNLAKIYTKEYGKRDFLFKGLMKSKRRSQLISEPGTIANLIYYFNINKNYNIVNEFEIYKHHHNIRLSLRKILLLYFLLETVEKTTGYNDTNKSIFDLLVTGIETLSSTDCTEHFSVFFIIHLMQIHGIFPDFSECKFCHKDYQKFSIDIADFNAICDKCNNQKRGNVIFKQKTKQFIILSLTTKFIHFNYSMYDVNEIEDLLFYQCLFIENYFDIEIKSKTLLFSDISDT